MTFLAATRSSALLLALFASVLLRTGLALASADEGELGSRARALSARLLSPCCYQQTLDVHESELSTALRREIRDRLAGHEPPDVIERDLVARYGARIVAVPPHSPLESTALWTMLSIVASGGLVWWRARRWLERGPGQDGIPEEPERGDALDAKLDAELRRLGA